MNGNKLQWTWSCQKRYKNLLKGKKIKALGGDWAKNNDKNTGNKLRKMTHDKYEITNEKKSV